MGPPDRRRQLFEEIYRKYHDAVLAYLLRRTESGHDAGDVLAETFLVAWRRLDDIPDGERARPWLFGVARRTLANHHRGARRRSALSDRLRAELANAPCEAASEPSALAAAFRRLPEPDREVLSLAGWEGLDFGEIAVVLGCSRNAVRIRMHRARRRLARELRGEEEHGETAGERMANASEGGVA
ncbi:RNA polymerase sigma factor [Sphaerimonospora mesophila]|uniref:RNA polymerase sigma factor n=1 Tax=Sphaerimonospora mesophila TaxID=37483 RepID=UPI0006E3732A